MVPVARLYDENLYRFHEPQASYWEATAGDRDVQAPPLAGDAQCDVAIIGAGYTGLSAALHLARDHSLDACALDAGHIGWGASGRNGGFCTMGGTAASATTLMKRHGLEELRRYYRCQQEAVELVRDLIVAEGIDAEVQGDAEFEVAHTKRAARTLEKHCNWQRAALGLDAQMLDAGEFRKQHFDSNEQFGAARIRPSFALHPLRYQLGLARAAGRHGARLHAMSEVLCWEKNGDRHTLRTAGGSLSARFVIVAANGFMPEDLHEALAGRVMPLISSIVVTRPLRDDELAAYRWQSVCPSINARVLLNYFRLLPDGRLLFGGRGHSTGSAAGAVRQAGALQRQLSRTWPLWRDVPIDYAWHGLICMTRRLTPALARLPDDRSVLAAFGYHGNGVNNATWCGRALADWIAADGARGTAFERRLPALLSGLPERFPLPSMRLWYLQAVLAALRLEDRPWSVIRRIRS